MASKLFGWRRGGGYPSGDTPTSELTPLAPGPAPGAQAPKTDYEAVVDDLRVYLHYEIGVWTGLGALDLILKNQLLLQYIDGLVLKHTKGN